MGRLETEDLSTKDIDGRVHSPLGIGGLLVHLREPSCARAISREDTVPEIHLRTAEAQL